MTEIFLYPSSWRACLVVAAMVVLLLQFLTWQEGWSLSSYRNARRFCWDMSVMGLPFSTLVVFVFSYSSIQGNFLLIDFCDTFRSAVVILCLLQCVYWWNQCPGIRWIPAAAVASLPVWDHFMPYPLLGALFFSLCYSWRQWRHIRKIQADSLSAYSIQQAIDSMPMGIMLATIDGKGLLINEAMFYLMRMLFNQHFRNAHELWRRLLGFAGSYGITKEYYGDKILFRFPDGKSKLFSRTVLHWGKEQAIQITAIDVTLLDSLNQTLEVQNDLFEQNSHALRNSLKNLEKVQQGRAYTEVASNIHDLMGQRITIFQQFLKNRRLSDYQSIIPLVGSVMTDLRREITISAKQLLKQLLQTYCGIGIHIAIDGQLPQDERYAGIFVRTMREAFTNAVLHGKATAITVQLEESEEMYRIVIADNGEGCAAIVPGQGLRSIRQAVEGAGGTLRLEGQPHFMLVAVFRKERETEGRNSDD
ncbi:ATP-binding protein [Megasphaera vaginalis (ex Srinivasan et al. 2021)]|uniref:GHKL domain protein n=1 Tax=Megasphaera vaginalis (ex Srinivasan et al. 2021) TaxID=1111454 RepID=U7UAY0_9FIRM|nr:ATP-binding protein [Megasphaera vaginalis (ex Srinivasan et al. 2021)]ERT56505.1 GHKL domain protein [Megasphaera vaginalis (ex Srinivasan et al. 2021)]